jgi:hypothetical protein
MFRRKMSRSLTVIPGGQASRDGRDQSDEPDESDLCHWGLDIGHFHGIPAPKCAKKIRIRIKIRSGYTIHVFTGAGMCVKYCDVSTAVAKQRAAQMR